ncbi:MAG TPA: hypothetical protein VK970_05680 [Candidatus Methylacidiphilales bacterium]|nr:hypothetical protein [Candidatus Methylacidiphilales bacterium]
MVTESQQRQSYRRSCRQQTFGLFNQLIQPKLQHAIPSFAPTSPALLMPAMYRLLTLLILSLLLVCANSPRTQAQTQPGASPQAGTPVAPATPPMQMPVHANTPTDVARVWMELNLVQDLPRATLVSDSAFRARLNGIPTSKLILIKSIRERADFQQLALEMRNRMREYVTFGTPEILPDGRNARVPIIINEKNFNEWMLQNEIASEFIQQYVRALKDPSNATRVPTVETVKSFILSESQALKRKIEDSRQRFKEQPDILVVLEPVGWRVNVTAMETERAKRIAAKAKEKEDKEKEREAQRLAADNSAHPSDGNGSSNPPSAPPVQPPAPEQKTPAPVAPAP